jgi:glucoamylase
VWSRDLVESAGAFFALYLSGDAREVLRYLIATQQEDGHWHQNQWLGGRPYWRGIQLDETGFPVVLAGKLAEHHALQGTPVQHMVSRALRFLIREGPVTNQDRWEECQGLNAFTLAVMIAALVEGAAFVDEIEASFALSLADEWCHDLDSWLFAEHTSLSEACGVPGHYVRMAPPGALDDRATLGEPMLIKNRSDGASPPACDQVALDFLQLVRFGLRSPDDPCIVASVTVADRFLRVETPSGPCWYRYTGDGYGEKEDGSPFDGTGRGRPWPLLTGERGHYALCRGEDITPYLKAMVAMTGTGGLLPEQIWDGPPLPSHHLEPGKPTGSAMPLVWAHAEFVKLAYSQALGVPVDRPAATAARYRHGVPLPRQLTWTMWQPRRRLIQGRMLRVVLDRPALVHWGSNGWQHAQDVPTQPVGCLGYVADLPCAGLAAGESVEFTWRWNDSGQWLGQDHQLPVVAPWQPNVEAMRHADAPDAGSAALQAGSRP